MSTTLVDLRHAYDRDSNRLTRKNVVAEGSGEPQDQSYVYDRLNRLAEMKRGLFNSLGIMEPDFGQQWGLDPAGNWSAFDQDHTGDGTWDLRQERTTNKGNEIAGISNNPFVLPWSVPQYDAAGNMTSVPKPRDPAAPLGAVYDAWNRLVRVEEDGETVAEYEYDGRSYRTVKTLVADGTPAEARHCYYSSRWQVLEERVGTPWGYAPERQYVWGIGINELIVRDRATGESPTLNERLYALQDSHLDVVCTVNTTGTSVECYEYEAYGKPSYFDGAYNPVSSSAYDWTVLYSGYLLDSETALYYVRYRYYHDTLGLWITRDPLYDNWQAGIIQQTNSFLSEVGASETEIPNNKSDGRINMYLFCDGNALNVSDYSGLTGMSQCDSMVLKSLLSHNSGMVLKFQQMDCALPSITCGCCDGDKAAKGGYILDKDVINVCKDHLGKYQTEIDMLLEHELIHAFQYKCLKLDIRRNCENRLCTEITASYNAECSLLKDPWKRKQCVKSNVRESLTKQGCASAMNGFEEFYYYCAQSSLCPTCRI